MANGNDNFTLEDAAAFAAKVINDLLLLDVQVKLEYQPILKKHHKRLANSTAKKVRRVLEPIIQDAIDRGLLNIRIKGKTVKPHLSIR